MSLSAIWDFCQSNLQQELPTQQFITWIQPLQLITEHAGVLCLLAPNRFVKNHVEKNFQSRIEALVDRFSQATAPDVVLVDAQNMDQLVVASEINPLQTKPATLQTEAFESAVILDSTENIENPVFDTNSKNSSTVHLTQGFDAPIDDKTPSIMLNMSGGDHSYELGSDESSSIQIQSKFESNVDLDLSFDSFVEGKSNQLAKAAAMQVAENPGGSYNPLFLYGASGLGKTHLMHAVGNELLKCKPNAKVAYLHSERFVANMVKAIQQNKINEFKQYYRSVDALLIDDIQFFAGKDRSQEEFFHTFNALIEGGQQIILTCDRYPREVEGLEDRLKTRFGWGLSVAVEPPELETRVAILMQKARQQNMMMSEESAFFIARRLRSNVRELEGALKRVIAQAHFKGRSIDIELIKESLKDLLSMQDRLVSIDNIQRTVAEYYKIKVADLHSKRRNRSVARPRQVAMSLAKELTSHSLPEIGDSFGGRDHTTVLHACRKIDELKETNTDIAEDLKNLLRTLTA